MAAYKNAAVPESGMMYMWNSREAVAEMLAR
jgi:hypothetical protein